MGRKERRDGVRVQDVDGFHSIVPYVMPKRTEAEVSMSETFDVTALNAYMKPQCGRGHQAEALPRHLHRRGPHGISAPEAEHLHFRPPLLAAEGHYALLCGKARV